MVSRHKTSVKKLLALDHIYVQVTLLERCQWGAAFQMRKYRIVWSRWLSIYEGNNKVELMKHFLNDLSSIKNSLTPIPQSPHSDAYVRKLTPAAVPVKWRSNRIRVSRKKVLLTFSKSARMWYLEPPWDQLGPNWTQPLREPIRNVVTQGPIRQEYF